MREMLRAGEIMRKVSQQVASGDQRLRRELGLQEKLLISRTGYLISANLEHPFIRARMFHPRRPSD